MPASHALMMKISAGGASRRSGPTIVREAPLTDAAATSFSLAELLGRDEALIVLSSPRVLREGAGTKPRRPHQVEIEGGDSL